MIFVVICHFRSLHELSLAAARMLNVSFCTDDQPSTVTCWVDLTDILDR